MREHDWAWFRRADAKAMRGSRGPSMKATVKAAIRAIADGQATTIPDEAYPPGWVARWYEVNEERRAA
jgi:hypothetical protein